MDWFSLGNTARFTYPYRPQLALVLAILVASSLNLYGPNAVSQELDDSNELVLEDDIAPPPPSPRTPPPSASGPGSPKGKIKTPKKSQTRKPFGFGLHGQTQLPVSVSAGIDGVLSERFKLSVDYGLVPSFYATTLGSLAGSIGGNAAYKDVISAALQTNTILKIGGQFAFTGLDGWRVGLGLGFWSSSGKGEIDKVLEAATGKSYSNIKTILTAAGRSTKVNLAANLMVLDVTGGYSWRLTDGFYLEALGGLAAILSAETRLSTELPNLDSSAQGNSFLRSAEADLNSILKANGVCPLVSASLTYWF